MLTVTHAINLTLDQILTIHIRPLRLSQIIKLLEKLLIIRDQLSLMLILLEARMVAKRKRRRVLLKLIAIHAIPLTLVQTHITTGKVTKALNHLDQLVHQLRRKTIKKKTRKKVSLKLIATLAQIVHKERIHIIHMFLREETRKKMIKKTPRKKVLLKWKPVKMLKKIQIATHVINQIKVRTHIMHMLVQPQSSQAINQEKIQLLDKKW